VLSELHGVAFNASLIRGEVKQHRAQPEGTRSVVAGRRPAAIQDLFRELPAIFATAQIVRQQMEYSMPTMEQAIFRYP